MDRTPERVEDLRGEVCPYTFVKAKLALEEMEHGEMLAILVDHDKATVNVPRSFEREGHEVAEVRGVGPGVWEIRIVKVES
ncbi:MAG: sulfurtransferase TusA family protein [Candidatus Methylomirabilis sp.]|nr:sulfurtransferase TusA family protein [Deltaproteobacteria bacterium]